MVIPKGSKKKYCSNHHLSGTDYVDFGVYWVCFSVVLFEKPSESQQSPKLASLFYRTSIKHSWSYWIDFGCSAAPSRRFDIRGSRSRSKIDWIWLVASTWLQAIWKIFVKMGIFPKDQGENQKCLSCHHLGMFFSMGIWIPEAGAIFTSLFNPHYRRYDKKESTNTKPCGPGERHEWPWYPVIKGDFFNLPRDHQMESITLYGRQKIRQLIAFRCKPDICHTNIAISHCHIVNTSLRFADLVVEKKHSPNGGMKWCFGEFHPVERIKKIAFPKNPSTPQIWVILRTKKTANLDRSSFQGPSLGILRIF